MRNAIESLSSLSSGCRHPFGNGWFWTVMVGVCATYPLKAGGRGMPSPQSPVHKPLTVRYCAPKYATVDRYLHLSKLQKTELPTAQTYALISQQIRVENHQDQRSPMEDLNKLLERCSSRCPRPSNAISFLFSGNWELAESHVMPMWPFCTFG